LRDEAGTTGGLEVLSQRVQLEGRAEEIEQHRLHAILRAIANMGGTSRAKSSRA